MSTALPGSQSQRAPDMSLPPSYVDILNELNRDVIRARPADPLQFCANWFNKRLEEQRTASRARSLPQTQSQLLAGRSPLAMAATSGAASGSRSSPPPFGSLSHIETERSATSPFSQDPLSRSPFGAPPARSAAADPGSIFSTTSPFGASEPLPTIDTSASFAPHSEPSSSMPSEHSSGSDFVPSSYNFGRRTSVSAESLAPTAVGEPARPKTVIPKTEEQLRRIEASIGRQFLFRSLDEDQYKDVLLAMEEKKFDEGVRVIEQGAVGDYFYVVESGALDVYKVTGDGMGFPAVGSDMAADPADLSKAKKVDHYEPGGAFGELALMYNAPRAATVITTSPCTLWALDRVTFRSILMEHTSRKRRMYESFLGEVPLLRPLEPYERAKVADALESRTYEEGEIVVAEGEPGTHFFLVESGHAIATKKSKTTEGAEEIVGNLHKGDYFGELALLNDAPRAATVRVSYSSDRNNRNRLRVASLGEKAFTRLLGPVSDIMRRAAVEYPRSSEVLLETPDGSGMFSGSKPPPDAGVPA